MICSEFIEILEKVTGLTASDSMAIALTNYPKNRPIERRHAAKMSHLFLRDVLGVPDEKNISRANELVDLYDCHTCAGDIAQVYLKGIMPAARFLEFGTMDRVDAAEAYEIAERIRESYQ